MSRFAGRVAIVTGGSQGIGAAVALRLAAEGAQVVLVARRREPAIPLLEDLGEAAEFVAGDVADPGTAERAVRAAEARGGVDVLVNNAAVDFTSDLLETTPEQVEEVFRINVFGAVRMLIAAGRAMRERGGAIVNVTSRLASIGVPTMSVYAASKGALLALTRSAALDLAPLGIRVNAVAPGLTETPLVAAWLESFDDPAAQRADVLAGIPQARLGAPGDVAAAVAFLASDDAAHITGASLAVDGGYTAA